jgi:SAM-dependent methyltransferase
MYHPELYDIVTPASFRGDTEWYVAKALDAGGPILELGAGTGRITLQIAQAGCPIHALDADRAMLDRLQQKLTSLPPDVRDRVSITVGDMRSFALTERFALVIAPFRAFLHNLTQEDQLASLARVREHLRPGGRFAFNVYHPSLEYMRNSSGALAGVWRWVGTFPRDDGGWIVALRSDEVRHRQAAAAIRASLRGVRPGWHPDADIAASPPARLPLPAGYPASAERGWLRVGAHRRRVRWTPFRERHRRARHRGGGGMSGRAFDRVEALGLTLPHVAADTKYDGSRVLKRGGAFMAGMAMHASAEPETLVVRMTAEDREHLLADAPDTYYITDYYQPHLRRPGTPWSPGPRRAARSAVRCPGA